MPPEAFSSYNRYNFWVKFYFLKDFRDITRQSISGYCMLGYNNDMSDNFDPITALRDARIEI